MFITSVNIIKITVGQLRKISDKELLKRIINSNGLKCSRISQYHPEASKLINASRNNNYTKLSQLVSNGIPIDSHDTYENTVLTDASSRGDFSTVKYVGDNLNPNFNASCDCPHHKTPLHYASETEFFESENITQGKIKIVQYLIKSGAIFSALNSKNQSALDVATPHTQIYKLLLDSGCKKGSEYLHLSNCIFPLKSSRDENIKYTKNKVSLPQLPQKKE